MDRVVGALGRAVIDIMDLTRRAGRSEAKQASHAVLGCCRADSLFTLITLVSFITLAIVRPVAIYSGNTGGNIGMTATASDVAPNEVQGLKDRLPTAAEIDSAAHAATAIAVAMELDGGLKISGENGDAVHIAPAVGELIIELLGHVSAGNMVTLVPVSAMLTTQQAADIMNVSRPHLTKLLKQGEIQFEEVGKHRRVPLRALMEYRENKAKRQEEAMRKLSRLGQEYDRA